MSGREGRGRGLLEVEMAAGLTRGQAQAKARSAKSREIPLSLTMILVTVGIVYGDIGTSPMYTMRAIVEGNGGIETITQDTVLGAVSLIIWTMTLITTVKYVLIAMKADNNCEGGIFALYGLVRRHAGWLILPAMIGGSALLADGILTPAVTVTTAVEGLKTIDFGAELLGEGQERVILITLAILAVLFIFQRSGTSSIGKAFGPVMTLWFLFLAFTGVMNIGTNLWILRALNPLRGIMFLFGPTNHAGLMVLGSVFLCTTGAEALYSDMGHVGKRNIFASWPFVKVCLILNYLGQGVWLVANNANPEVVALEDLNPFFQMLPEGMRPFAVIISAAAAIIASQALITGSYTLVSEAIRLDLMPHMKVDYPSETKGQLYIPLVNYVLWAGCSGVVLLFQSSSRMEAAYGLAITLTMLMTTLLLYTFISRTMRRRVVAVPFVVFFAALEGMFFLSSLTKFTHGGYVTVLMSLALFLVMITWHRGTAIERSQTVYLHATDYITQLDRLRHDLSMDSLASNLVFLTNDSSLDRIDRDLLYSILDKQPKRAACAYWFVNVRVTDDPYTNRYVVNSFGTNFVFKVQLQLGFRMNQNITAYLNQITHDLVESGELAPQPHSYSIYKNPGPVGDFRFCLVRKQISQESELSTVDYMLLKLKYMIRTVCGSPMRWYGLENSSVIIEYVPLFRSSRQLPRLDRVSLEDFRSAMLRRERRRELEAQEESDIFSRDVRSSREEGARELIGGDTAVFEAVRADEEDEADEEE